MAPSCRIFPLEASVFRPSLRFPGLEPSVFICRWNPTTEWKQSEKSYGPMKPKGEEGCDLL